jgi:NTP pyrophosphatase (non-canonical NTP hydrolase)
MRARVRNYEDLEDGELVTFFGVHVLRWDRGWGDPTVAITTEDSLAEIVSSYFKFRGLTEPDTTQSFMFLTSEMGELGDALVHTQTKWVRNNPQNKGKENAVEDEIGDCLMMLVKLADTLGIDPIEAMMKKMRRKGWEG